MNWITRCPACGTTYKVVPDQLKLAQGWLRCGQCHHAFDSTGLVLGWPEQPTSGSGSLASQVGEERLDIEALLKQEDASPPSLLRPTNPAAADTVVAAFEEALSTFQCQVPLSVQGANECETEALIAAPSAVDQTNVIHAAPYAPYRAWVTVVGVVLLLALALQCLWLARYWLAGTTPAMARGVDKACHLMKCEILPLPVRDAVRIENSSLTPHDGGLLLSWSVRNITSQPVQMPALELTLLDAQDKALVRRVLGVTAQGAPSALTAGQIWEGQRLIVTEEGLSPSGYRLLSFYL